MNFEIFMGLAVIAVKFSLDVLLPIVDVGSDVYFTWDVYNKGDIKYFITSGIFLKRQNNYSMILLLILHFPNYHGNKILTSADLYSQF